MTPARQAGAEMEQPAQEQPKEERKFIELKEAAKEMGISRAAIYTYVEALNIKIKKFPKDRSSYVSIRDFNKMKATREAAINKKH